MLGAGLLLPPSPSSAPHPNLLQTPPLESSGHKPSTWNGVLPAPEPAEVQPLERKFRLTSHTNMSLQLFTINFATRHDAGIIILHFCEAQDSKTQNRTAYPSETKAKHIIIKIIKPNPTGKSGGGTANLFSLSYTKPPIHHDKTIKRNPRLATSRAPKCHVQPWMCGQKCQEKKAEMRTHFGCLV